MKAKIEKAIKKALEDAGAADVDFALERPADMSHGDYATNAALVAAKKLGKNPHEVAKTLTEKLLSEKSSGRLGVQSGAAGSQTFSREVSPAAIEKIEIAGAGFINFFLSREAIAKEVEKAALGDAWGINSTMAGTTVMVEYTQPNPFKPFHIGHLMSNTIGESIARLLEASGAAVLRVNYQGDVGLHIAKALWGLMKKGYDAESIERIAEAYVLGNAAYEDDAEAKREIIELNKKVYASDASVMPLYARGREVTLARFEELYAMLGTTFDHYFFESDVWRAGEALVREGLAKGIFEESDGAIVFRGEKAGLHTRVFITREGLPTYEAKDLGLALAKLAYAPFDLSITTTAVEQKEYFKVVFEALAEMRPELRGTFASATHGMMRLARMATAEGFASGKMSSRKGNVITGESLLMDLKAEARKKIGTRTLHDAQTVAEQVAVGAIKYAVLKQGSDKDIVFDREKSLSLEGDSGPYLQYARVRALSLMEKAKGFAGAVADNDPAFFTTGPSAALGRILAHFPDVVERAARELEPHYVTTYLTEVAAAFNSWYASERIIVDGAIASEPLFLTMAVESTLQKGLAMLGIPAPEEM